MDDKRIILVNGPARNGKTTFINQLKKYTEVEDWSTIDKYKDIAKESYYWNGDENNKDEKVRKLLSDLKIAGIEYNDIAFKDTCKKIEEFKAQDKIKILCITCRDIPEIEKVVQEYPEIITVFIHKEEDNLITSNVGDANVYNYTYDYYLYNNSTLEEFEDNIDIFYAYLCKNSNSDFEDLSTFVKRIVGQRQKLNLYDDYCGFVMNEDSCEDAMFFNESYDF